MTPSPQTQEEADRVDLVYQTVLVQMGASASAEVLALWQDVPVGQAANAASSLLGKAVTQLLTKRGKAMMLGLAYYRLVRALRTGATIADPTKKGQSKNTSLELLRQEFEAIVAEVTGHGRTDIDAGAEPESDDDSVRVEPINGLTEALEADEASAGPYLNDLLSELMDYSTKTIEALPDTLTNGEAKAKANALHLQHGAMIAAAGAKSTMNGARNATHQASARDSRVQGWIRIGDGDPCYFCAMLISRGPVYKNERTAGAGAREDGRVFAGDGLFKFHDNCGCTAEPVYQTVNIDTDPKYAENRYYRNLWDTYISEKFSGDDAINEWRKLIRRIRAQKRKAVAPEAA